MALPAAASGGGWCVALRCTLPCREFKGGASAVCNQQPARGVCVGPVSRHGQTVPRHQLRTSIGAWSGTARAPVQKAQLRGSADPSSKEEGGNYTITLTPRGWLEHYAAQGGPRPAESKVASGHTSLHLAATTKGTSPCSHLNLFYAKSIPKLWDCKASVRSLLCQSTPKGATQPHSASRSRPGICSRLASWHWH